jgi:tRNA nucleotidyltransferase (CCA-adding enzyme)
MWSHFHHEADIGVRGTGNSCEHAFEQAAIAMTAVVTNPETVSCVKNITIECEANDIELLFVDWLNALVFEMATRKMLFNQFKVSLDGLKLTATACGEPIDVERHQPAAEVKGATYTELAVAEDRPGEWQAQCVVDV